jgi:hypothetical protein
VAGQWLDLAVDVAARIVVPPSTFLLEDLRVRRGGLDVEGVVIGPVTLPGRVEVGEAVGVPLDPVDDPSTASSRSAWLTGPVARDVRATLPWPVVARWPEAAAVSARDADGTILPVVGPGLPDTVAPTDSGAVLVGWDEPAGLVRRIVGPDPIPVVGRLTSVRATVGEDVTVLSEVPIARARVAGSNATATNVEVHVLPGLALTGSSELAVAAGAGDQAVRVGRFRLVDIERGPRTSLSPHAGVIEWDAEGLADLRRSGAAPALVWLAVGRSLRLVAPVEIDAGRVLALTVGDRWVLAPSTTGRAMLVVGRGLRIRTAQAARRVKGSRGGV